VAAVFSEQIRGRNVLITGTTIAGLGFETARVLAKYANLVVITGYNQERLKLSEEALKKDVPAANIRTLHLDLSSLGSVRAAAQEVKAYPEPLHVLIHSAVGGKWEFTLTPDNLEVGMAANHVGPFLLTNLLAPKLLESSTPDYTPRVVFVSSAAHASLPQLDITTLAHPDPAKYTFMLSYGHSKAASILTAIELSKRSNGKIKAYSLHPGVVFTSAMQREEIKVKLMAAGTLTADGLPNTEKHEWKTLAQGAATTVAAAFDTRLEAMPGAYLCDAAVANDKVAPHASDPAIAAALWTATEEILGERFAF